MALDRPSPTAHSQTDSASTSTGAITAADAGSHLVMFWLLVGMAAMVFAPCVIIPIWSDTEELVRQEYDAAIILAQLQARLDQQDRLIRALTSDPLVNERIARQELRFGRRDEELLPGASTGGSLLGDDWAAYIPPEMNNLPVTEVPEFAQTARKWLPNLPWVELFGKPPNRTIFLLMAGGLLVAAFVLFGHNEQTQSEPPQDQAQS